MYAKLDEATGLHLIFSDDTLTGRPVVATWPAHVVKRPQIGNQLEGEFIRITFPTLYYAQRYIERKSNVFQWTDSGLYDTAKE